MGTFWDSFIHRTSNEAPRPLYLEAAHYIPKGARCLDVAAGGLRDTKDMLQRGYVVDSFDSSAEFLAAAQRIHSNRLHAVIANMESFDYGQEKYDYINAMFALPFIAPEAFNDTFRAIVASLKHGGVYAFQLFTPKNATAKQAVISTHTLDQARELVRDVEIIKLSEHAVEKEDGSRGDYIELIIRRP